MIVNPNDVFDSLGVSNVSRYAKFLREGGPTNSRNDIAIYTIHEVKERNETFEIKIYLPEYVLIGDDGGGKGFLIHAVHQSTVYSSGFGDFSKDYFCVVAPDFAVWA